MKKEVKKEKTKKSTLQLEIVELESKLAPTADPLLDSPGDGFEGAEC